VDGMIFNWNNGYSNRAGFNILHLSLYKLRHSSGSFFKFELLGLGFDIMFLDLENEVKP